MTGLGTLINTGGIIIGGIAGHFFGKFFKERHRDSMTKTCGISVLFIGIAGAMEKMMSVKNNGLSSGQGMFVVISLILGTLIGEIINIEGLFEKFGEWLKRKTGNSGDNNFIDGFVTTSFTVCIGAMAVIGSVEDGIRGDYTILATKTVLDFIIVLFLTTSLGKGCVFSAIPVFILEGGMTLLAKLISPVLTDVAMTNLSLIGSILIFCVGLNLVWGKKIRVANMLPALIVAVAFAFIPITF